MSFLNLEILKGKLTKFSRILPHLTLKKTYVFGTKQKLKNKNCNSKNHSKFPN
jgi:hypothetical protein